MSVPISPLDTLIDRAGSLYSLPAVAMKVVQMTASDKVDTQALKETIETDPALTAKILRVVNSSMFGLSGEVGNLKQAIALLGAQPLKLLVLGFSLPDQLFTDLAGDALRRYWTTSLTRAVAARDIANDWFAGRDISGDDAFVAGLLRDLGALVLIQHLGKPYLQFLDKTSEIASDRLALERQSLGFDHVQLTASLLSGWKLPRVLIEAISSPSRNPRDNELAEVLSLAELVTQLACEHRIAALPDLLEQGEKSCDLDKPMVNGLVAKLQEQVDGLATAMRVPVEDDRDFSQVLFDAHAQMAVIAESAICPHAGLGNDELSDDELSEEVLAETHELRLTMRRFLNGDTGGQRTRTEGPHPAGTYLPGKEPSPAEMSLAARRRLEDAVHKLATRCRIEHTEMSLALATLGDWFLDRIDRPEERRIEQALEHASSELPTGRAAKLTLGGPLLAILLPGVDRRLAIRFCQSFASQFSQAGTQNTPPPVVNAIANPAVDIIVNCGVASLVAVPNKFTPSTLIEGASRCLSAAQSVPSGAVKSIEVY